MRDVEQRPPLCIIPAGVAAIERTHGRHMFITIVRLQPGDDTRLVLSSSFIKNMRILAGRRGRVTPQMFNLRLRRRGAEIETESATTEF